jgi:hypothetical protein
LKGYQQYLRQGGGKRRKRGGVNAKRGQIPGGSVPDLLFCFKMVTVKEVSAITGT